MKLPVWQEFFQKRAAAAHQLLADDGFLFCQLDAHSVHYGAVILDEIFGIENSKPTICWKRSRSRNSVSKDICKTNDFILWYAKSSESCINKLAHNLKYLEQTYKKDDDNGLGRYNLVNLFNNANTAKESIRVFPDASHPYWKKHPRVAHLANTEHSRRWFCSQATIDTRFDEDTLVINLNRAKEITVVYKKDYLSTKDGKTPTTWWDDCGTNNDAHKELCEIFGTKHKVFETPKPLVLMERIIHLSTKEGDWILDPFGGSGTTLQVGYEMNRNVVVCESVSDNVQIIRERFARTTNSTKLVVV
jgi:adenine-specific DNA-methyltransferase